MLDADNDNTSTTDAPAAGPETGTEPAKKATAKRATKKTAAKKTPTRRTTKKTAEPATDAEPAPDAEAAAAEVSEDGGPAKKAARTSTAKKTAAKKTTARKSAAKKTTSARTAAKSAEPATEAASAEAGAASAEEPAAEGAAPATMVLFQPPEPTKAAPRRRRTAEPEQPEAPSEDRQAERESQQPEQTPPAGPGEGEQGGDEGGAEGGDEERGSRRRRRRGGRRRRKGGETPADEEAADKSAEKAAEKAQPQGAGSDGDDTDTTESAGGTRRRRRRRRAGEDGEAAPDDPDNTVTKVRKGRTAEDEITSVTGSTRLEAKKQRRREGREAGRRRAPIVSEAEFLARREAVDRVMVIRQRKDLTQIAVLEDKVLVEHYVARESQTSLIGNVYLGRVQNVLPSMEAAFIDIGKGRNAVLYAGEVNWDALGAKDGGQRKIEQVLKPGQAVLVQVTKDPIGHKGARLTSQVSLPGRFLVYVPDGTTSGISRKLPDTERNRLKSLLKEIVPDSAGVIVRTAAEGASEEELTRDVERLTARWEDIQAKVKNGNAPQMLYAEPDLTLKVVRDLFTEDFGRLVVSGDDAWDMVDGYVQHLAPDLADRLEHYQGDEDVFAAYRIDEQIAKGLDRKVWLPSGGSLIIDRTEAMTVIDVNTGKFTGSGGNLEETVTKNNLEAAEEIVRQLRLRDIGGIIVVDFIDMVLESNRDLVLRRLVECLGRDRTRHQVAEVTSLGLVQMTRKRIGTGLLEAFSESCEHCGGRGLVIHHEPVEPRKKQEEEPRSRRSRRGRGKGADESGEPAKPTPPSPKELAAMARHEERPGEDSPGEDGTGLDRTGLDRTGLDRTGEKAEQEPAEQTQEQPAEEKRAEEKRAEEKRAEEKPAEEEAQPRARRGRERKRAERKAAPPEQPAASEAGQPANGTDKNGTDKNGTDKNGTDKNGTDKNGTEQPAPGDGGRPEASAAEKPAEEPTVPAGTLSPEPAPEPAGPRIVTSVRRRGARRPAGPPTGDTGDGSAASAGNGASGDTGTTASAAAAVDGEAVAAAADESGEPPLAGLEQTAAAHVPVKRKGSRKH